MPATLGMGERKFSPKRARHYEESTTKNTKNTK